jgi:hypothetical protein
MTPKNFLKRLRKQASQEVLMKDQGYLADTN